MPWGWSSGKNLTPFKERGVIGLKFFEGYNLLFDYGRKRLVITKHRDLPAEYNINNWRKVSFDKNDIGIVFNAYLEGKPVRVLFDSGASTSVLHSSISERSNLSQMIKKEEGLDWLSAHLSFDGKNKSLEKFCLFKFKEPKNIDLILGTPFIQTHRLFFDFENNVMYLSP